MNWKNKKFWSSFKISYSDEYRAHVIILDKKYYRTQRGNVMKITSSQLAKKVQEEWEEFADDFSISKLPLTHLLEQMNDVDETSNSIHLREILEYANTDLICYRVESPEKLRKLQEKKWDPVLRIYDKKYDIKIGTTHQFQHFLQEKCGMQKFKNILNSYDPQKLFIIWKITHLLGSAFISVLIEKKLLSNKKAWNLSRIEEDWQQQIWGADEDNLLAEKNRRRDFDIYIACLRSLD